MTMEASGKAWPHQLHHFLQPWVELGYAVDYTCTLFVRFFDKYYVPTITKSRIGFLFPEFLEGIPGTFQQSNCAYLNR